MHKAPALGMAAVMVVACTHNPIVDTDKPGFDDVAYRQDLAVCEDFAQQADVAGEALTSGLLGAIAGAALGAIGGAIAGDAGLGAAIGASTGGAGGLLAGGTGAYSERDRVVRNCLRERGYVILD